MAACIAWEEDEEDDDDGAGRQQTTNPQRTQMLQQAMTQFTQAVLLPELQAAQQQGAVAGNRNFTLFVRARVLTTLSLLAHQLSQDLLVSTLNGMCCACVTAGNLNEASLRLVRFSTFSHCHCLAAIGARGSTIASLPSTGPHL